MTNILNEADLAALSPTALAYVGDAVWALRVRQRLLAQSPLSKSSSLSRIANRICSAVCQARLAQRVGTLLAQHERVIMRRCANAHIGQKPKNSTYEQYHAATALEGLVGYLHLAGARERLDQLVDQLLDWALSPEEKS